MSKEFVLREINLDSYAVNFCKLFESSDLPKYILGRNNHTLSILNKININGIIDDFTSEKFYGECPIVKIEDIPNNSLVLVAATLRPLIAERRVAKFDFLYLDYYSFLKYSNIKGLRGIDFWSGSVEDLKINIEKYKWIYNLLSDFESKNQFYNLLNFRHSFDLKYMRGFESLEHLQYFEEFLNLNEKGEVFIDVGAFDGFTSEEFIRRCPKYSEVHIFEPEESNIKIAKERLKNKKNIYFYKKGLSSSKSTLKFDISGSSSKISEHGTITIEVDKLDSLDIDKVTFIKIDVEGFEHNVILGARETILKNHPKLAICVYHKKDDFWRIPELILGIRSDYKIYLRHYSEGFSETVMFFVPNNI